MKTALVTGAQGFVGRVMVRELISRGYEVDQIDIANPLDRRLLRAGRGVTDMMSVLKGTVKRYNVVVHLAYTVGGRATIDGVNLALAENVTLDAALFQWAVRTKQPKVLYFSSSAAYPVQFQNGRYVGTLLTEKLIDLNDLRQPDANYGWAKLTGERLAQTARDYGVKVSVCRPFSGYSDLQDLDYPFPSIVRRAKTGDLTVWGPPTQTRDWIYIDDVVKGALAVSDAGDERPVNLCTGVGTTMADVARMAWLMSRSRADKIETPQPTVTFELDKPTGVLYRVGNPTRFHEHYTPSISIEEGIKRAVK